MALEASGLTIAGDCIDDQRGLADIAFALPNVRFRGQSGHGRGVIFHNLPLCESVLTN